MTLKRKLKFFHRNWFWCQLNGIYYDHVNSINGNFIRYTRNCRVALIKGKVGSLYAECD